MESISWHNYVVSKYVTILFSTPKLKFQQWIKTIENLQQRATRENQLYAVLFF